MSSIEVVSLKDQSSAKAIATALSLKLINFELSHFADGEIEITAPKNFRALSEKILLIHNFSFDSSIDIQLFELLMFIGYLNQSFGSQVTLFIPYMPYSRQDKSNLDPKKIGLLEVFSALVERAGAKKIITCDIHDPKILEKLNIKIENISLGEFWSKIIIKNIKINNDFVLAAPDKGGIERVKKIAKILGLSYVFIEKQRIGADKIKVLKLNGDVENQNVILIDDIIDTGSTALQALDLLKKSGAQKVFACFSHGVLAPGAKEKLLGSQFEKIFITNSIRIKASKKSQKLLIVKIDNFIASL